MSNEDNHQHDSHYHGEPSRVLDDRSYPNTVMIYGHDPRHPFGTDVPDIQPKNLKRWVDQLDGANITDRVVVLSQQSYDLQSNDLELMDSFAGHEIPFHDNFSQLPDVLFDDSSLLMVPSRLALPSGIWKDLDENDVTVNWIAVDPAEKGPDTAARAVVLSDWIADLSPDLPEARSAGSCPGIIHLTSDWLHDFQESINNNDTLWDSFESLRSNDSFKCRPGFLRDRTWEFA